MYLDLLLEILIGGVIGNFGLGVIKMQKNILIVIGIISLFLGLYISPIVAIDNEEKYTHPLYNGNTLYVGGYGPGNYTRIQDAINDASSGDRIYVYSGEYLENLRITKTLTLEGENKHTTNINGNNIKTTVFINSENVILMDFTITNASSKYAGLEIQADNCIVENAIIQDCYRGVKLLNVKYTKIENCIINRWFTSPKFGFDIENSDFSFISNNTITNLEFPLQLDKSDWNEISNNNFISNEYGPWFLESHNNTFSNNEITNCESFSFLIDQSSFNIITNNFIHDNEGIGIKLDFTMKNTFRNNLIINNFYGLILERSILTLVINNEISNNEYGILLETSYGNFILKNNIIDNYRNANFRNAWANRWLGNYWEPHLFGPKIIFGKIYKLVPRGWTFEEVDIMILFKIDWNPAKEPYTVGV